MYRTDYLEIVVFLSRIFFAAAFFISDVRLAFTRRDCFIKFYFLREDVMETGSLSSLHLSYNTGLSVVLDQPVAEIEWIRIKMNK